jgi:hypothetical protein
MKAIATNSNTTNRRLLVLFVLLVLSSARMFGQDVKNEIVPAAFTITDTVAAAGDTTDSQMELVSWFMGSKQSQVSSSISTSNTISTNKTGKKQFINNGLTTNRILSRTFMKKAINHDSTIA